MESKSLRMLLTREAVNQIEKLLSVTKTKAAKEEPNR
jgi:hypothetical protein